MYSTGEYGSQDNPKIGCSSELRAHDRTENGAESGDIQELNHKDLPCRKRDIIHTVGFCERRCLAVIRSEDTVYICPV